ncbi:MAG: carotenoid oxygenase family protein [Myxococcota bacterium]
MMHQHHQPTTTAEQPAPTSTASAYRAAMASVPNEVDVALTVAEGSIPERLRGVHFRNGAGRGEAFGVPYQHPFDGDGHVVRLAFTDDGVHYRNRFVRTREWHEEEAAGRMLYRSFGTNLPGGLWTNMLRMRFKNAANTSVVYHAGKLLALWEGGQPHALDPVTLKTLGRDTLQGRLDNHRSPIDRWLAPELPFSAHPRIDPDTGVMWNFGTSVGFPPRLMLYQVEPDGRCRPPRSITLERLSFVHDFVLTPTWQVFMFTPVSFDIVRALLGLSTPVASLRSSDGPGQVMLVPRRGGAPLTFEARGGFIFHYTNGYEDEQGRVVIDGYWMDHVPSAQLAQRIMAGETVRFAQPSLVRFVVDPRHGVVSETPIGPYQGELPTIHPDHEGRPYRYVWATAESEDPSNVLFTALQRLDVESGQAVRRDMAPDLPGEPYFVPDPQGEAEDEGWVLSLVYRTEAHRSDLYVLDARTLKTVCRLELPHHVPPGFHGTWVEDTVGV